MRIAVIGGGPAGLYFAYLWKKRHPGDDVLVAEQNPEGVTWGFGVVFSDRAMQFLDTDDPETAALITANFETWTDVTLDLHGERIVIDGVGFSAIGRLELLQLLQGQARSAGVELRYDHAVASPDEFADVDLVVGADGVNSVVRRGLEGDFGTSLSYLDNKFIWFGADREFETLTQTFVDSDFGGFNAHHYRYAPGRSTFIVECTRATWLRAGFDSMDPAAARTTCEAVFADTLAGASLISNNSWWRNFPWIRNRRWWFGNRVLVGDALRTAHFSIGSGTRLALEDVLVLVKALEAEAGDLAAGLTRYQAEREPVVDKLIAAARASADWYEHFDEHMACEPYDFAYRYITRSGRVDDDRLRSLAPRFMAARDAHTGREPTP